MDYSHLITIDPAKRSGQPCIRDLRMTVQDVLEYLASGMSVDEVLVDFPDLTSEDIRACLAYAADRRDPERPASFLKTARSLDLKGPSDWSANYDK